MSYEHIPLNQFAQTFADFTELSSVALGGHIVSVSDEFFAEASHLLLVEPAPSMKGQFGPNGALYSGWESRRHNPTYDWCIIQLGTSGTIYGFDIDTAHFSGNEAPQASVAILQAGSSEEPRVDDPRWTEILPKVDLGPNSRHLFKVPPSACVNFVKLNMYPDGGIARFRVYGDVSPVFAEDTTTFDLAHVFAGGRVVYISDQHFGVGHNLILPGRGKDMGDGWETKRSRASGHKDWVVIQLGAPGLLEHGEIDTAHFKGNFPESCEMHALMIDGDGRTTWENDENIPWVCILPRTKLGPHRQHYFQLENVENPMTHVKVTIYPDGGLKRVRINGKRAGIVQPTSGTQSLEEQSVTRDSPHENKKGVSVGSPKTTVIPALPLTPEAFAAFGNVVQAYEDHTSSPKGIRVTPANGGSATKYHKLSYISSSYPEKAGDTTRISVYRCKPFTEFNKDGTITLTTLERHPYTTQAFIPMGRGNGEGLRDPGDSYLVVVAKDGRDDRPDLQTLRAFISSSAQGVVYNTAIWHQPMTVLGKALDFACVETQIGDGSASDCEVLELGSSQEVIKLRL